MKIFAIKERKKNSSEDFLYGYLFYEEQKKEFQIQICENVEEWRCPIFFSSFVKKREYVIGKKWSKVWVQQRILPWERQNLQEILLKNHMALYDEYELLIRTQGRCGQDDCYLELQNEMLFGADQDKEMLLSF